MLDARMVLLALGLGLIPTASTVAQEPQRILANRVATLGLPLYVGDRPLQEVIVRISGSDGMPSIGIESLRRALVDTASPDAIATLDTLEAEDGFLPIRRLGAHGLELSYDPAGLRIIYAPEFDATQVRVISARRTPEQAVAEPNASPAIFSAFLNLRNTARFSHDEADLTLRTGLDGAVRVGPVVLESIGAFDGLEGLSRFESRAVYDMPALSSRISFGDVFVEPTGFQIGGLIGGISFEKTDADRKVNRTIHPVGGTSFLLERRAKVEIYVNDQLNRRVTLEPGTYEIGDLALSNGQNGIRIRIQDDHGRVEEKAFTVFFDRALLTVGESEYFATLGVGSRIEDRNRQYNTNTILGSAFYRRGLTGYLTAGLNGQFDRHGAMIGGEASAATSFGAVGLDLAASWLDGGQTGYALDADLSLGEITFEGARERYPASIKLSLSHESTAFRRPGQTGLFENPAALGLDLSYVQTLSNLTTLSVSGNADYVRGGGERYGVQTGISHRLGPDVSLRGGLGFRSDDASAYGFLGVSYRLHPDAVATARYDTRNNAAELGAVYSSGERIGALNASLFARHSESGSSFDSDLDYTGNRFTAALSHDSFADDFGSLDRGQITSARFSTAIAFADGAFAIGQPIVGSFAIVDAHRSLAASEISIRDILDGEVASSGKFGAALLPVGGTYGIDTIRYDVDPRPIGYSDDEGLFRIRSGYKDGYRLTVGSDYFLTAVGSVFDSKGQPIANLLGIIRELGDDNDREISLFTNGAGRFAAQGLRAGRWEIVMPTRPETLIEIEIPATDDAFVRLGELTP